MRFAFELERFVYNCATPTMNEKLWSKGVAMHAYSNRKSIKWTWAEPFEINAKVKLVSNFVVNNKSRFFDA